MFYPKASNDTSDVSQVSSKKRNIEEIEDSTELDCTPRTKRARSHFHQILAIRPGQSTAGLSGSTEELFRKLEEILCCIPDENAALPEGMSHFEAANGLFFGVILPTVDVWSDLVLAITVSTESKYPHPVWISSPKYPIHVFDMFKNRFLLSGVSFICPSLSFLFVTYHWWQLEKPRNRLKTLPFLLAQVWPQYRMLKLIYKGYFRKDPRWRKEATVLQENLVGIEPFIESVPQCFWYLYLWYMGLNYIYPVQTLLVTFITSVLSAGYGLTNFLRVGPLKTIPNQPASGFGHLSFWLVFLTILSSLFVKGLLMFWQLVVKFPAISLMPVFTPFTFGPDNNKMTLHYGFTFLNLVLTGIGIFCCFYLNDLNESGVWYNKSVVYSVHSLAVILIITLILTDKLTCCTNKNIKPNRSSRAIDLLLANPSSTNNRETYEEDNPENPEETPYCYLNFLMACWPRRCQIEWSTSGPLRDIESATAQTILTNSNSNNDRA